MESVLQTAKPSGFPPKRLDMVLGKIFIMSDGGRRLECITIFQGWCQTVFPHVSCKTKQKEEEKRRQQTKEWRMKIHISGEVLSEVTKYR